MRVLSRLVLRELVQQSLVPLEVVDVYEVPPYDVVSRRFVNNVEPISVGGLVYQPLGWSRGAFETQADDAVDRITITLDDVERFWGRAVQMRTIQGMRLKIRKVFMGLTDSDEHTIVIFDGLCGAPKFDDTSMAIEIRSILAYHDTELPNRLYGPSCPYFFGESRCGVDVNSAQNRVKVLGGSGSSKYRLRSQNLFGYPADYFRAGYVQVLEGPDLNMVRPVLRSRPGYVEFVYPFEHSLEGQTVYVKRGCLKTKQACKDDHDNLENYGGFSEVPKPPAIDV